MVDFKDNARTTKIFEVFSDLFLKGLNIDQAVSVMIRAHSERAQRCHFFAFSTITFVWIPRCKKLRVVCERKLKKEHGVCDIAHQTAPCELLKYIKNVKFLFTLFSTCLFFFWLFFVNKENN